MSCAAAMTVQKNMYMKKKSEYNGRNMTMVVRDAVIKVCRDLHGKFGIPCARSSKLRLLRQRRMRWKERLKDGVFFRRSFGKPLS
jgi:hypothetical protein